MHYEFASRGQTINKEYYVEVLKRLRGAVRRKRPRFWSSGDWLLQHDNAPAHLSNLVQKFLAKHKILQLRQIEPHAGSVWFNQMGTTSKDASVWMTKNSTNAEI